MARGPRHRGTGRLLMPLRWSRVVIGDRNRREFLEVADREAPLRWCGWAPSLDESLDEVGGRVRLRPGSGVTAASPITDEGVDLGADGFTELRHPAGCRRPTMTVPDVNQDVRHIRSTLIV